jgi:hypothetical protein
MPVPTAITDLDTTAAGNSPPGTESAKGNIDDYLRAGFAFTKQLYSSTVAPAESTIASAASVAIGAATTPNVIISGTTTVTAFDTVAAGIVRNVRYSGAVPVTHNATSMILLGEASRTHVAGDCATFLSLGAGNWKEIKFSPIGALPVANGGTGGVNAAAARAALGAAADADVVKLSGAQTIADTKTFSSGPLVPTAAVDTNTSQAASTSFVLAQAASATPSASLSAGSVGTSSRYARGDHAHPYPAQLSTATGSAPSYTCRAWVNFNGSGVVTPRADPNVSSITDNGVGDYTINFAVAMSDANYCALGSCTDGSSAARTVTPFSYAAGSVRVTTRDSAGAAFDPTTVTVAVIR